MYVFSNAVQISLYFLVSKVVMFQTIISISDFIKVHLLLYKKNIIQPQSYPSILIISMIQNVALGFLLGCMGIVYWSISGAGKTPQEAQECIN